MLFPWLYSPAKPKQLKIVLKKQLNIEELKNEIVFTLFTETDLKLFFPVDLDIDPDMCEEYFRIIS